MIEGPSDPPRWLLDPPSTGVARHLRLQDKPRHSFRWTSHPGPNPRGKSGGGTLACVFVPLLVRPLNPHDTHLRRRSTQPGPPGGGRFFGSQYPRQNSAGRWIPTWLATKPHPPALFPFSRFLGSSMVNDFIVNLDKKALGNRRVAPESNRVAFGSIVRYSQIWR